MTQTYFSAWDNAWGLSWGYSWGLVNVPGGGPGTGDSSSTAVKDKPDGFANERAAFEASIKEKIKKRSIKRKSTPRLNVIDPDKMEEIKLQANRLVLESQKLAIEKELIENALIEKHNKEELAKTIKVENERYRLMDEDDAAVALLLACSFDERLACAP